MADERIRVEVRNSQLIPGMVAALHLLVLGVAIAIFPASPTGSITAVLAIAASLVVSARFFRSQAAVTGLELDADRVCKFQTGTGVSEGLLLRDTTAFRWLIVIRRDTGGGQPLTSLLLVRASLADDDWRRLQVFLRWGVRFDAVATTP